MAVASARVQREKKDPAPQARPRSNCYLSGASASPCRDLGAPCIVTTLACGADADEPLSTDAALRRARCAAPRSDAAVVSIAQQFGAATYHFLVEDLGRWLVARGAVPHHAPVRVAAPARPAR